jgi:hypothetical protein
VKNAKNAKVKMAEKSFASYNDENIFGKTLIKSANNLTVIGPIKHEIMYLIESSLSLNTWNVYDNAIKVFEDFRLDYNLEHKWPVPVSDLINFIVYLSSESYSPNTAKSYLAGIHVFNDNDLSIKFIISCLKGSKTPLVL